jgi:hypothetical protein
MDSAQLIVIVQEYEELYNLGHPDYSNQQRRDISKNSQEDELHLTMLRYELDIF